MFIFLVLSCSDYELNYEEKMAQGPGSPEISVNPPLIDFGVHAMGDSDSTAALEIKNVGTEDLEIASLDLEGLSDAFVLNVVGQAVLQPSESMDVIVTMSNQVEGEHVDAIHILSNDRDRSEVEVPVFGTVGAPLLVVNPPHHDFGSLMLGDNDSVDITLSNIGTSPLTVTDMDYSTASSELILNLLPSDNGGLPWIINQGQSRTVKVHYDPTDLVYDTGTLTVRTVSQEETAVQAGNGDSIPVELTDDCTSDATASLQGGEIYVLSWNSVTAQGTIEADQSGWYHIYDNSIAESGSSQQNETGYIRIYNSTNGDGTPRYSNCDADWIVEDPDNYGSLPPNTKIYMGTFWLEAGNNAVELNHYCPLYRSGSCTSFHNSTDSCDGSNVNSLHFNGEGLCLESAD